MLDIQLASTLQFRNTNQSKTFLSHLHLLLTLTKTDITFVRKFYVVESFRKGKTNRKRALVFCNYNKTFPNFERRIPLIPTFINSDYLHTSTRLEKGKHHLFIARSSPFVFHRNFRIEALLYIF